MKTEFKYIGPNAKVWIGARPYDARKWTQEEILEWMKVYPKEVGKLFRVVTKSEASAQASTSDEQTSVASTQASTSDEQTSVASTEASTSDAQTSVASTKAKPKESATGNKQG